MGKKSLIKSTSKKKKTTSKKKDVDKKSKPVKKTAPSKTSATKKAPAKKKTVAQKKVSEKKATLKELIFKKFEREIPDELFTVEAEKRSYSAPPLISVPDEREAERIKALLFKKIDLTSAPEKRPEMEEVKRPVEKRKVEKPSPKEEKTKKADYKEIMARKFHEPAPAEMVMKEQEKTEEEQQSAYTAPPLISTDDEKEAARLRELLFRQFEIPPVTVEQAAAEIGDAAGEEIEEAAMPGIEEKAAETDVPVAALKTTDSQPEEEEGQLLVSQSDKDQEEKTEQEDKGPKGTVSYDEPPPTDTEVSDPMNKIIKLIAAGFALIFLLIIGASVNNQSKYYIVPVKDGVEVWKGRFAPMGEDVLAELEGVAPPENIKDVYEAHEVLPMVFSYYVDRSDSLLDVNDVPDLKAIKGKLDKAMSFASTKEDRAVVHSRLNLMEKLVLQYKANVAASRGTPKDLAVAIGFLNNALKLDIDDQQKSMIQDRIAYLQEYRNELLAGEEAVAAEQSENDETVTHEENGASENEAPDIEESEGSGD
ncbi:MAG: hypothetical protein R6U27_05130 [Desulfobacterales bacterium]